MRVCGATLVVVLRAIEPALRRATLVLAVSAFALAGFARADDPPHHSIDLRVRCTVSRDVPAVTAAIIGPRTMDQLESQLGAADVQLDKALLERIDEIVAPGTTINPTDAGWTNPALAPAARRRD